MVAGVEEDPKINLCYPSEWIEYIYVKYLLIACFIDRLTLYIFLDAILSLLSLRMDRNRVQLCQIPFDCLLACFIDRLNWYIFNVYWDLLMPCNGHYCCIYRVVYHLWRHAACEALTELTLDVLTHKYTQHIYFYCQAWQKLSHLRTFLWHEQNYWCSDNYELASKEECNANGGRFKDRSALLIQPCSHL